MLACLEPPPNPIPISNSTTPPLSHPKPHPSPNTRIIPTTLLNRPSNSNSMPGPSSCTPSNSALDTSPAPCHRPTPRSPSARPPRRDIIVPTFAHTPLRPIARPSPAREPIYVATAARGPRWIERTFGYGVECFTATAGCAFKEWGKGCA
eukprot:GFKZ01012805.1.p2 GENE.GFKZ01012805.1~~GFKZ01012805.1.p2  ORF type:complete len:150 (+),score=0.70 GFKZ01012805.1:3-452(+)